jgi:hypothetical protein
LNAEQLPYLHELCLSTEAQGLPDA